MRDAIMTALGDVERTRGVRIIHAVESGSRAWGFASKDSDWDVRFLYVRPLEWYLSAWPRRDVIEPPLDGLLDLSGWDIRKAAQLAAKSNPVLFEWLGAPAEWVYSTTEDAREFATAARVWWNSRAALHHYLHMADGNFRHYIVDRITPRMKKYLYVLRPILACRWIEKHNSPPPVLFDELMAATLDGEMQASLGIEPLLARKRAGEELEEAAPIPALSAWLDAEITRIERGARVNQVTHGRQDDLDAALMRITLRGLSTVVADRDSES